MTRLPLNPNLTISDAPNYNDLGVQTHHGPLILDKLQALEQCFDRALAQYARVCMMRFDLHFPENCSEKAIADNQVIEKFVASLKAKIANAQHCSLRLGHRVHGTQVRYVWTREVSSAGGVHYHVILLLNHDAYAHFGKYDLTSNNMYTRIHEAWASALNMYAPDVQGLIHIPENAIYLIKADDVASLEQAFYRASYLCKVNSKDFGKGRHIFGCSRS